MKEDATVSQLLLNRLVHLNTCSSKDHTDDKLVTLKCPVCERT